jgi:hypothetical protein
MPTKRCPGLVGIGSGIGVSIIVGLQPRVVVGVMGQAATVMSMLPVAVSMTGEIVDVIPLVKPHVPVL